MKKSNAARYWVVKIMQWSFVHLCLAVIFASVSFALDATAQELLERRISIQATNQHINLVLSEIEKTAEVKFSYSPNLIRASRKITVTVSNEKLSAVLDKLLIPQNLTYEIVGRQIILKRETTEKQTTGQSESAAEPLLPPDQTITGTVSDVDGSGLPGVSILVKGTQRGTTTDPNGKYKLDVPNGDAVLVFSFVGYLSQEVVVGNRTQLNISLKVDNKALDEVVVVGYGTAKKKDLTGAVSSVNIEDTRLQPNTNASQILRGTTAGVQVIDNGRPGQAGTIRIRGINSISASTAPLIVLDGIIYAGGNLADINPNDIESIDVLKDASSTAIYGSLAANGVIEITTKKGKTGKPKFTFNTYTGVSDYAFLPKYLNAEQYLTARKDAEIAAGGAVPFQPIELENIAAGNIIDPFEVIKQDAPISNYELSVAGKTDKVNYFFSGAFMDAKSPVKGDNFSRISSRLNLGVQATDWLKIGVNSGYSSRDDSGVRANLLATTYLAPYGSIYMPDGTTPRLLPMDIGLVSNPIFGNLLNTRSSLTNVLFTNIYGEVSILDGLSYKINGGYTRTD